jgi:hypothetical protein
VQAVFRLDEVFTAITADFELHPSDLPIKVFAGSVVG